MDKTISATEVVRNFSELLNQIKFRKERYTILRGGKAIASLGPATSQGSPVTVGNLLTLCRQLPSLGEDARDFEREIERSRRKAPQIPKGPKWE
jgi:antitoxin (DNA-binding transcriptional repressor) of toxin-antitoxin stability system